MLRNLITDDDGPGYFNLYCNDITVKGRINGHSGDATTLFSDLVSEKKAIIAHRGAGYQVAQAYSMKSIMEAVERGVYLVELDVERTTDADDADKTWYISHGNAEEYIDDITPVTTSNFQSKFINTVHNAVNYGETLPTLKRALDLLLPLNVAILLEDKSGDHDDLVAYLEQFNAKKKIIFQDFDQDAVEAFKNAGYKTMRLSSTVPTEAERAFIDYYCTATTTASTFQSSGSISQFFVYTVKSPYQWQLLKQNNSKLVGCFSDCPLPCLNDGNAELHNRNLLDAKNMYVASYLENQNDTLTTRCEMVDGYPKCSFDYYGLTDAKLNKVYNFFGYKMNMDDSGGASAEHYFKIYQNTTLGAANDWFGIYLRMQDYNEIDAGSRTGNSVGTLFRNNGNSQMYRLDDGVPTSIDIDSTGTLSDYQTHEFYWVSLKRVTSGTDYTYEMRAHSDINQLSGSAAILSYTFDTTLSSDLPYGQYDHCYLMIKCDDTTVGSVQYMGNTFPIINENFSNANVEDLTINGKKLFVPDLPTSSVGLTSGQVWISGSTLTVVP